MKNIILTSILAILTLFASLACSAQTRKPVRKPTTTLPHTTIGLPTGCPKTYYEDWYDGQFSIDSIYCHTTINGISNTTLGGFPKWNVSLTLKTFTNGIPFIGTSSTEDCYGMIEFPGSDINLDVSDPDCEHYQDACSEDFGDYTIYLGRTAVEGDEYHTPERAVVYVKKDNSFVFIIVKTEYGVDYYAYTMHAYLCPSGVSDSRYLQGKPKTTMFPKKSIQKMVLDFVKYLETHKSELS